MVHSELPRQPCPPSPEAVHAQLPQPPFEQAVPCGYWCGRHLRRHPCGRLVLWSGSPVAQPGSHRLDTCRRPHRDASGVRSALLQIVRLEARTPRKHASSHPKHALSHHHTTFPRLITTSHTDSSSRICVLANPVYARAHLPSHAVTARFPHLPPPPRCRGLPPSPRLCVYDLL